MKIRIISIMITITVLLSVLLPLTGCAAKDGLQNVINTDDHTFTCTYKGVTHICILDFPEGGEKPEGAGKAADTEGAPLIVMLHGYAETPEGFRTKTKFHEAACPRGYVVAYVSGASDPNDATSASGWNSGIGLPGKGKQTNRKDQENKGNMDEADSGNDDTGFLVALAEHLKKEYSLDRNRIYAVGFSNGAFMVHRLAMEANDTYHGFVSVAGMMPEKIWEERKDDLTVSFFQVTGEKDNVIPKNSDGSAKYAKAPAIEEVMAYYAAGLDHTETYEVGKSSLLSMYTDEKHDRRVWHLFIQDGRHSWPDENITGIGFNDMILDFFEAE